MTIADDLRAAANSEHDLAARLWALGRIGVGECAAIAKRHTRLRAHADTIERVEREMRIKYGIDRYYPARDWANALLGDKP